MAEDIINRMASDLGIERFKGESDLNFRCRTVYSGMACWIKAAVLDRPIGSAEAGFSGVSRRHVLERCSRVLDSLLKLYPDMRFWFYPSMDGEHPIVTIRSRLLNHGDLLNEGFDTNIVLATCSTRAVSKEIEVVKGKIIQSDILYSGIAAVRYEKQDVASSEIRRGNSWFEDYIKAAWWKQGLPDFAEIQYYNPRVKSRNNYSQWQETIANELDYVVLARCLINKSEYEYYLLRITEKLMHKIDPFLQRLGEHIRIMFALRSMVGNSAVAKVVSYENYVELVLNFYLPREEIKLLESYAWPIRDINDKLSWIMSDVVWKYIKVHIEALEIKICEDKRHG